MDTLEELEELREEETDGLLLREELEVGALPTLDLLSEELELTRVRVAEASGTFDRLLLLTDSLLDELRTVALGALLVAVL